MYAGLESLKLGYGGDRQMAEILGLDVSTVARGRRELLEHDVNVERVRKAGCRPQSCRKKTPEVIAAIEELNSVPSILGLCGSRIVSTGC